MFATKFKTICPPGQAIDALFYVRDQDGKMLNSIALPVLALGLVDGSQEPLNDDSGDRVVPLVANQNYIRSTTDPHFDSQSQWDYLVPVNEREGLQYAGEYWQFVRLQDSSLTEA